MVERALAGALNQHLNSSDAPDHALPQNSRNVHSSKTIQSEQGAWELAIPRDHQDLFEPFLVPKHQRRLSGLDEKILALYARGMSTRDIALQLEELYGVQISPASLALARWMNNISKHWNRPIKNWRAALPHFAILFPERFKL